jgi:nitrite reductase (NADH) large subunit
MATGAHPFVPPIVGANKAGVHVLRLLDDARTLQEQVKLAKSVVIIGGGVLGLECAAGMTGDGRKVTVLEGFDWLMPRQLNRQGAAQLEKFLGTLGIDVMTGVSVKELLGDEHVAGIGFADGSEIAADLVVLSTGVRPNSYLARLAGLQVDKGVLVNDLMETSHSHVYAAGDIAEHRGVLYGLWNAAQYQGTIAGLNAIGKRTEFAGIPRSNSLKVLGVDLLSIGKFEKTDGSELLIEGSNDNHYSLFLFRDSTLIGCILFGDTSIGGQVKKAIESKRNLSSLLKKNPTNIEVFDYLSK